jgi:hypothetical protein
MISSIFASHKQNIEILKYGVIINVSYIVVGCDLRIRIHLPPLVDL